MGRYYNEEDICALLKNVGFKSCSVYKDICWIQIISRQIMRCLWWQKNSLKTRLLPKLHL